MSAFDERRVALVQAEGSKRETATGYFLTGSLVLTAKHVGTSDSSFEVRSETGGAEKWSPATVVWTGAGNVDAKLLRTDRSFGDWEPPELRPEVTSGPWRSSGFASIAVDQHAGGPPDWKTLPLSGSLGLSGGQGQPLLALSLDQHMLESRISGWGGVSGSPIFADGAHGGLIGLITDASRGLANGLFGLPISQLAADIGFVSHLTPSFLGDLPQDPFCAVLTREGGSADLVATVANVLAGESATTFAGLHPEPVEIDVRSALGSVRNWVATVEALARADYLVADVTLFQPAVMLLLGIRSVLRRGVTVSVSGTGADPVAPADEELPFNVQETRLVPFSQDSSFYKRIHQALAEGAASLANDPAYLDLPAYHAVRVPRPESWATSDRDNVLVLCPYGFNYQKTFDRFYSMIKGATKAEPRRMLDLRSPRLVGQALYEEIRWASKCVVDWSHWRPNVFFELGVRLGCSDRDPLSIIDVSDQPDSADTSQKSLLVRLLQPVAYDPERLHEKKVVQLALADWAGRLATPSPESPPQVNDVSTLPSAGTFSAAQEAYRWQHDSALSRPDHQHRRRSEQILGADPIRLPERMILFAGNTAFDAALSAAAQENRIAQWLYLRHRAEADDPGLDELREELMELGPLVLEMLKGSSEPRHAGLRREVRGYLRQLADFERERTEHE
ncbi:hypothetical protein BJ973_003705 [Actinoplanes tereljensis]|uniref:Serine protease n=1 Tax=Paractinoplanes tereljensis TaxID=571912 RepID=A0A919TW06_9ACTN|nr:trypsin-like peptidase domain-containing protein [Actinoplanes tereljensis]GIF25428.1 hypothetical protein Ate02nite_81580 [Actinoplanes tereljensis]